MENGADKIRINPGNIGSKERIRAVVDVAKERNIPIRVGVNSGSLEKELVAKYHGVTAEGLVESALDKVHLIEENGYDNLVISIKSSDVMMCVHAHELIAKKTDYPLHVGITEAGTITSGHIRPDDRIAARGQDFQRMHGQCRNAAANQHTICHCRGAGHPIILLHRRSARGRQGRTRWRTAPCRPQDTSPAPPASSGGKRGT